MFRLIGKTHPGAVREHNEDAFYCDQEAGLAVVADGMGGYAAGEVASDITVKAMAELNPPADKLVAALVECHNRITAHADAHSESKGMGAAVVAAKLEEKQLSVCWAGDSRAYLFNREAVTLKAVSRDHSYVQFLLSQGQISEAQARAHPDRNLVTQCLGLHPPQPELTRVSWSKGDILLMCSDGVTDELPDATIRDLMGESSSLEAAANSLVEASLAAGGKDNITVILAENLSPLAAPAPSPAPPPAPEKKNLGTAQSVWVPVTLGVVAASLLIVIGVFVFYGL